MSDAASDANREYREQGYINEFIFDILNDLSYMATYKEILECYNAIVKFRPVDRYFYIRVKKHKVAILDYLTRISQLDMNKRRFVIGCLLLKYFHID